jgi:hypothetical protein
MRNFSVHIGPEQWYLFSDRDSNRSPSSEALSIICRYPVPKLVKSKLIINAIRKHRQPFFMRYHNILLVDYDGVRLCLRTAATNGPIVHPQSDMLTWRVMVMVMMPVGDNSWLVHQSSLAVLPAETSGASRKNGREWEFCLSVSEIPQGIFNMP